MIPSDPPVVAIGLGVPVAESDATGPEVAGPESADRVSLSPGPFSAASVMASVAVGSPQEDTLHADERALVTAMSPDRRATFVAGRQALRAALDAVAPQHRDTPLLRTVRGAPQLPVGVTGSISHKQTRAIAIAARSAGELLGLDLERRPTDADAHRPSIADRILTAAERDALRGLDALAHREATLVRFALKEAVYKAIDPYVHRYVRFTEVELDVRDDGAAVVRLMLPELSAREVLVESRWRVDGPWIIAVARSSRG